MFSSLLPLVRTVSRPCPPIVKATVTLLQAASSTEYNVTAAADSHRDAVTQEAARRLKEKTNFEESFFGPENTLAPALPWAATAPSIDTLALRSRLTQELGAIQRRREDFYPHDVSTDTEAWRPLPPNVHSTLVDSKLRAFATSLADMQAQREEAMGPSADFLTLFANRNKERVVDYIVFGSMGYGLSVPGQDIDFYLQLVPGTNQYEFVKDLLADISMPSMEALREIWRIQVGSRKRQDPGKTLDVKWGDQPFDVKATSAEHMCNDNAYCGFCTAWLKWYVGVVEKQIPGSTAAVHLAKCLFQDARACHMHVDPRGSSLKSITFVLFSLGLLQLLHAGGSGTAIDVKTMFEEICHYFNHFDFSVYGMYIQACGTKAMVIKKTSAAFAEVWVEYDGSNSWADAKVASMDNCRQLFNAYVAKHGGLGKALTEAMSAAVRKCVMEVPP